MNEVIRQLYERKSVRVFEDKEIENDLRMVDETIRAYWELAPLRNVNDVKTAKKDAK